MRISDWSSDVCSSDLRRVVHSRLTRRGRAVLRRAPPLLHERFTEAFQRLSPVRQSCIIATLDEIAAMMGAAELDAAPLLDTQTPVARAEGGLAFPTTLLARVSTTPHSTYPFTPPQTSQSPTAALRGLLHPQPTGG